MKTYILLAVLLISSTACNKQAKKTETPSVTSPSEQESVVLSAGQMSAINIKTGHIARVNLKDVIKANGYFDVPPQNNAVISPLISGYVRKINKLIGDKVSKGDVLAELESIEFIDLQQKYVETNARASYLAEEYNRQTLLQKNDAVSRKQFLAVETEYKSVQSMLDGLRSKLNLIDVNMDRLNAGTIAPRFLLRSPISGSVKKMNTVVGRFAEPATELFEIIDTDHLHLELNVYEKDVMRVKKGQKVWFQVPSQAHSIYEGEVFLVGQDLSEDKRAINVHVHIHDNSGSFTVGMYANASIVVVDNPSFTLPVSAVVTSGANKFVFKKHSQQGGEVSFDKVPVFTGIESEGLIELTALEQLTTEDEIVTEGAFYLLNAFTGED